MALLDKYKELVKQAEELAVEDLHYTEKDNTLHIQGVARDAEAKNKLWDVYSQIDPNFISGEVILDVDVVAEIKVFKARLTTTEPTLNVHKGPGVELPVIGHVTKDQPITLIGRANGYWWLIRSDNVEGYCYIEHIELESAT